jgi:hypothetical protein
MKRVPLPHPPDRRLIAGAAITLWIAVSPWVWGFADSHPAVANHVSLVFGFGPLALLVVNLRPAAFVTLLGGIWLVVSPWLLGYATDHVAWLNELVTGLLLIAVCVSALELPSVGLSRRLPRFRKRGASASVVARPAGSRS